MHYSAEGRSNEGGGNNCLMLLEHQKKKGLMMARHEQYKMLVPSSQNLMGFEQSHHQRATPMSANAAPLSHRGRSASTARGPQQV